MSYTPTPEQVISKARNGVRFKFKLSVNEQKTSNKIHRAVETLTEMDHSKTPKCTELNEICDQKWMFVAIALVCLENRRLTIDGSEPLSDQCVTSCWALMMTQYRIGALDGQPTDHLQN